MPSSRALSGVSIRVDLALSKTKLFKNWHSTTLRPEPSAVPFMGHPMPPVYEDECLSSVPPYMRMNASSPSCSILDPTGNINAALAATDNNLFGGGCLFLGKLTPEERREKIHRYMKKRNERNFSKKIKYACRKTLADSRPRVRGRFAKNDELEMNRHTCCISNQEEDTDEDLEHNGALSRNGFLFELQ